jgi:hypothetical protein
LRSAVEAWLDCIDGEILLGTKEGRLDCPKTDGVTAGSIIGSSVGFSVLTDDAEVGYNELLLGTMVSGPLPHWEQEH